jgi:hypothetical protein
MQAGFKREAADRAARAEAEAVIQRWNTSSPSRRARPASRQFPAVSADALPEEIERHQSGKGDGLIRP